MTVQKENPFLQEKVIHKEWIWQNWRVTNNLHKEAKRSK